MTPLDQALAPGLSAGTDPGDPEFGPPAPAVPPVQRARRARWIALALVLFLAGSVLRWTTTAREGSPGHPSRWDPRVADLAAFVESERLLRFRHPVSVDFLSDADFRRDVTSDDDLSDSERKDIEDFESTARAVGLARGDTNLLAATNTLNGEGILAFYDPDTERVKVRGTDLTPRRRATLVHELTHALQDQHFDLSRQGTYDTDAQNSALKAVIEGDAMRVEHAYVEKLSGQEAAQYDRDSATGDGAGPAAGVPDWLKAYTGAPYVLGEPFVEALVADGGPQAVDRALRKPPASEEQLMDAARYLEGDEPLPVRSPKLAKGDRLIDRADFGTFSWLVMLAERIPARDALTAVDGWGGDAYVAFERQGRVCVRATFTGDTRRDTDEMAGALDAWARAMPPGAATVTRNDGRVEVFSCDPGPAAETAGTRTGQTSEALSLLANRATVFAGVLGHGASSLNASCLARGMVGAFDTEELSSEELPADFDQRMAAIRDRCFASRTQPVQS
jgi:hypothetical protein